jgi:chromosome segregation ATPase
MPLLIGLIALIVLQVRHNRKTSRELTDATSENKAYFHEVSSLNTDKNTLQTVLDETKRNFDGLTKKQISLRESNTKLDELNKIHLTEISRLSAASNQYIQDFQDLRDLVTASQKALQQSKDECNARLMLLKEKYEKEIEEFKSKKVEPASASSEAGPDDYHAPRRSFFPDNQPKRR